MFYSFVCLAFLCVVSCVVLAETAINSCLIQLSQSLDVHPMGLLLCGKIASIIKGMSLEDYHKTFELEKDFTPEEEEAIRKDNSWAES